MKDLLVTIALLGTALSISAQTTNQVRWETRSEKINENTYNLHFTAIIVAPWHIYSQDNNAELTLPTSFEYTQSPLIELAGKAKENGKLETESLSGSTIKYYENQVEFVQTVRLKVAARISVTGKINYMACSNGRCLPPGAHRFSFSL